MEHKGTSVFAFMRISIVRYYTRKVGDIRMHTAEHKGEKKLTRRQTGFMTPDDPLGCQGPHLDGFLGWRWPHPCREKYTYGHIQMRIMQREEINLSFL